MKLTLLQMVTSIMSDMDSDAITSINDTPESLQVASIIQDIYYQLISTIEMPELEQLVQLGTVYSTATFTATAVGTALTTSAVTGTILPGMYITGTGITAPVTIVTQTSGTAGGAGVYTTSAVTTCSAASVTGTAFGATASVASATGTDTNLTITTMSGYIQVGALVVGTNVPASTYIVSQTSGTTGLAGVYVVNTICPNTISTLTIYNTPNYLEIPTNIQKVNWIKYDKIKLGDTDKAYAEVRYLAPQEFIDLTIKRKSSSTNMVFGADPTNAAVHLIIQTDKAPEYWTCFDDTYLCFDSYDSAVDTTGLVGSKSLTWGQTLPVWSATDNFTPVLDDDQFPFLLAEAKSTCFMSIKQVANPKVEKQSRFQRIMTSNDRFRTAQSQKASINGELAGPNFGRRNSGLWVTGAGSIPYGYKN